MFGSQQTAAMLGQLLQALPLPGLDWHLANDSLDAGQQQK